MDELNQTQTVTIVAYEEGAGSDRSLFGRQIVRKAIDVEKLEKEVQSFLAAMDKIVGNLNREVGEFQMDSVTVSAEISAKGSVGLLGTGGEMAGKGGMTFTFKRRPT